MKRAVVALLAVALLVAAAWFRPDRLLNADDEAPRLQGYVEGEFVKVGPTNAGRLVALHVDRGDFVEAGSLLFELDDGEPAAGRDAAKARLAQAEHTLANLEKGGRPSEIEAAEAEAREARAMRDKAEADLARGRELFRDRVIARQRLDELEAAARQSAARFAQAQARLATVRLAARADEIAAQRAAVDAARAALAEAEWRLAQTGGIAPAAGLVADTLFRPGEHVPAGRPVVSLLPPENVLVRFFAPEPIHAQLAVGMEVAIGCDGCPPDLTARVSFIAPEAEFTPPVIYSEETRRKLVFMVEARPARGQLVALKPGLPVSVSLPR